MSTTLLTFRVFFSTPFRKGFCSPSLAIDCSTTCATSHRSRCVMLTLVNVRHRCHVDRLATLSEIRSMSTCLLALFRRLKHRTARSPNYPGRPNAPSPIHTTGVPIRPLRSLRIAPDQPFGSCPFANDRTRRSPHRLPHVAVSSLSATAEHRLTRCGDADASWISPVVNTFFLYLSLLFFPFFSTSFCLFLIFAATTAAALAPRRYSPCQRCSNFNSLPHPAGQLDRLPYPTNQP